MILQIALSYDKASEEDLIKRGFKKQEVYVKNVDSVSENHGIILGHSEFNHMRNRPFEYVVAPFVAVKMD